MRENQQKDLGREQLNLLMDLSGKPGTPIPSKMAYCGNLEWFVWL